MVAGFAQSPPNETLIRFAAAERGRAGGARALDIGCGAARNAVPLARAGWDVVGVDLVAPMLAAAVERARDVLDGGRVLFAQATMHELPVADGSIDLIVAHGVWNLATTDAEFRTAVREAARVAKPGAALFVFTFSRHTIAPGAPSHGTESFIFTQFSGQPQCFLTAEQLVEELSAAGFAPDAAVPMTEHNMPKPGAFRAPGPPVIYEAAFRFRR